jgi:hypothetical protein
MPRDALTSGWSFEIDCAEDLDRPSPHLHEPDRHVHAGRLAGAIAAEEPEKPSLTELERHAMEDVAVAIEGLARSRGSAP